MPGLYESLHILTLARQNIGCILPTQDENREKMEAIEAARIQALPANERHEEISRLLQQQYTPVESEDAMTGAFGKSMLAAERAYHQKFADHRQGLRC